MSDEEDIIPLISVLYVDDEEDLLMIGKLFLERSGLFSVDTISSVQKALSSFRIQSYDAIVSDYQMPGMDGIEFLKAVREQYGDIPFILFTGRGREEVVIEAINNGADFYLQKGGEPKSQFAELSHKIRQAVRRKQAEKSLRESEKQVSDIINFLPDATFSINQERQVIAWNRALEEMTGFPSASIIGKEHTEYVTAFNLENRPLLIDLIDEPDEIIQTYYPTFYHDGSSIIAERDLTLQKGKKIFATIKVSRLYNQEGEITGAIETIRDITPLKNTEFELLKSEQRYRSIVNDQTDFIARFNSDGTITFTNEAYRQKFAPLLDLKDIEGKNVRDMMQIQNYPVVENFLRSLSIDAPTREMEREIIGIEGEKHWQLWTVRALFDTQSNPVEYQVSGKDITRLKRDEEEIAFKNLILKTQQEASPDAVLIVDSDGMILGYNKNFQTLWEVPEDLFQEGKDEPILQYVSLKSADQENFLSRVRYLYEHPDERSFEEILLQDERTIERYSSPMIGPDNTYFGRVWFFRDITERKRADDEIRAAYEELSASEESLQSSYRELLTSKQALQDSESRLRTLIDNTEEAVSMTDEEGRIIEWNPSSERISGILKEEALGMYVWDLTSRMIPLQHQNAEYKIAIEHALRSSLKTGVPVFSGPKIITGTRPDGTRIITRQRIFPIPTDHGYRFGSISHDITEEKLAEEALRESEERFRGMAERSSDLILLLDRQLYVTYASPASRTILGYEPEELLGKNHVFAAQNVFDQGSETISYDANDVLKGESKGKRAYDKDLSIIKKDGTRSYVSLHAVPIFKDGVLVGAQASIREIRRGDEDR